MTIYDALKKDHRLFESLLDQIIQSSQAGDDRWKTLLDELRSELIPHAHAEEAVFYNLLREEDQAKGLVLHSYAEHAEADTIARVLVAAKAIGQEFTRAAEKLRDDLRHHIQEEETRVFDAARAVLSEEEAERIGEAFEKLKPRYASSADSMLISDLDLIANLMPPRFMNALRRGLETAKEKLGGGRAA